MTAAKALLGHRRFVIIALSVGVVLLSSLVVYASFDVIRPMGSDNGGKLKQDYLYGFGDSGDWPGHRGVDLSYPTGTRVNAIYDGTVVDLVEWRPNDSRDDPRGWGNLALVRLDRGHWNHLSSPPGSSYVYVIYAHLQQNSVQPQIGDHITAGSWLANSGNTGGSSMTGAHLHVQFCLDPSPSRTMADLQNLVVRNPELWLQPLAGSGRVVGLYSDTSGNPIGNMLVYGLTKPTSHSSSGVYSWYRTYRYTDRNKPDDLLGENWATSDVPSGAYTLTITNSGGTPVAGPIPITVTAGHTTYVGLYPFYLPEVRYNYAGWNTTISIRNKGSSVATVTTTYFNSAGYVQGQRSDTLAVNGSVSFTAGATGAAMVVGSQDLVVSAVTGNGNEPYAYTAIPHQVSSSGIGVGTTLYVANTLNNYWGWYTNINVQNTTGAPATVTYQLYNADGTAAGNGTVNLAAWGSGSIPRGPWTGWAKLTSTQPIAGMLDHWRLEPDTGALQYMAYPLAAVGAATGYMPSMLRQYWSWNSAYLTTNVGDSSVGVTTEFRPPATTRTYTLPARNHYQEYLDSGDPPVPVGFVGSGRTTIYSGSGPIVTAAQHSNTGTAMGMQAIQSGSTRVDLPLLRNGTGNWTGALVIQNTHPSTSTYATITLYNTSGSQVWQGSVGPISPLYSLEVMRQSNGGPLPNTFEGSVVVTASTNIAVNVQQSIENDHGYAYAQP